MDDAKYGGDYEDGETCSRRAGAPGGSGGFRGVPSAVTRPRRVPRLLLPWLHDPGISLPLLSPSGKTEGSSHRFGRMGVADIMTLDY